ncbi:MAG: hypothetical protein ACOY4R_29300 [Pseudomonadota bacterium]
MSRTRLLLAFLGAPLVPAAVQATIGESEYHPLAVFVVAMVIIYILQRIVGIPGYVRLHRTGRHGLRPYALFGFCVGACICVILVLAAWLQARLDIGIFRQLFGIAYWGVLGLATTVGFWFVARPDRAERPATPKPS